MPGHFPYQVATNFSATTHKMEKLVVILKQQQNYIDTELSKVRRAY